MKLPENFEREYFSLLTPVVTDGTVKNRRNLLVSAFSISLLYVMGRPLSELSVLGIKLADTDGASILIAALLMVLFWFLMFCIHASKDAQINKERRHLLLKHANAVKQRHEFVKDNYSHLEDTHPNKREISATEKEYDIYLQQKQRTKSASGLALVAFVIEYGLPLILGAWCMVRLIIDLCTP